MSTHIDEEIRAWDKAAEILKFDTITQFSKIIALLGAQGAANLVEIGVELDLKDTWILNRQELLNDLNGQTLQGVVQKTEGTSDSYELTTFGRAVLQQLAALSEPKAGATQD